MDEAKPEPVEQRSPPPKDLRRGYIFWGLVVAAILLVELAGAAAKWLEKHIGVAIPWTTISGMVGHLEELWPTSAVVVVGIIAPVAFYALAAPVDHPRRSDRGRWYIDKPTRTWHWYSPWLVFALSAIVGFIAVSAFDDDFVRAYFIYGALFTFGIFVPSLLVLIWKRDVGFTSLFVTLHALRKQSGWKAWLVTTALAAGLSILFVHLAFYPWPDITKEPVNYAGITGRTARLKAVRSLKDVAAEGQRPLYSTQTRGVVNGREAWIVFFTAPDGAESACVVTVTKAQVQPRDCVAPTP